MRAQRHCPVLSISRGLAALVWAMVAGRVATTRPGHERLWFAIRDEDREGRERPTPLVGAVLRGLLEGEPPPNNCEGTRRFQNATTHLRDRNQPPVSALSFSKGLFASICFGGL